MTVGIIGAGPAGITAAHELTRRGVAVAVFEAGPHVGGLARSFNLWGHTVDLGPHRFFCKDARVNALWHDVVGNDFRTVDRLTRILHDHKLYAYPLRPANALRNMGMGNALACLASYARQKLSGPRATPESFEDWVVDAFGRRLFDMFFKDYSEKLWGIPCDALDADFAAQRIKRFSLGAAVRDALGLRRGGHRTLVGQFAHPTGGTGMVYDRMAAATIARGGIIHLNTPVRGVTGDGRSLHLLDGTRHDFDHIISTMPLTSMARSLPDLPVAVTTALANLQYRNTILVYLRVADPNLFPDQWLYVQSPDLRVGRITNFNNWATRPATPPGDTVLALEYWCDPGDTIWTTADTDLAHLASRELTATGLIGSTAITGHHVVRLPKCYPVYRRGYRDHLATIIAHLRTHAPKVTAIGRYGAFKYNNQDHSILMGILAAENLAANTRHDLWSINTDYTDYQEEIGE